MTERNFFPAVRSILEDGYEANAQARAAVADRDAVVIMGPSGVGVDTVLELAGLERSWGATTHPLDPSDRYTHVNKDGHEAFMHNLTAGNFLFASQQPYTRDAYGLLPTDVPETGLVTLNLFPKQLAVAQAMFRSVQAVYLTTPFSEWEERLRGPTREAHRLDRMREGFESLASGLSLAEDICVVANRNGNARVAATIVQEFVHDDTRDPETEQEAREIGKNMARGLRQAIRHEDALRKVRAVRRTPAVDA